MRFLTCDIAADTLHVISSSPLECIQCIEMMNARFWRHCGERSLHCGELGATIVEKTSEMALFVRVHYRCQYRCPFNYCPVVVSSHILKMGCAIVKESTVVSLERWGRFERLLEPGMYLYNPFTMVCAPL